MVVSPPGETPGDNRPTPDPTVLTTEALERGLKSERDYVDGQFGILAERLRGIDKATEVVADGLANGPIQRSLQHLRELTDEKFTSVGTQFQERDARQRDATTAADTAIQAAFKAQQEIAAVQNAATKEAAGKSEANVKDLLTQVVDKVDDLRNRVGAIESTKVGATEVTTQQREVVTSQQQVSSGQRQNLGLIIAGAAFASSLVLGLAGIVITLLLR